uniref:PIH1D1/2/3 CS-like domain-containing protein n=1 Tax=Octactis speculum TaxID=3111310 RepID=A0A7S2CA84_9STRA|mmetsp:Transcript_33444/g.45229  ORF Transcript_33444/g.45229 Transcript_33444/m.45229 type:complete len:158 (+) Transcript_33444:1231-1704(+)
MGTNLHSERTPSSPCPPSNGGGDITRINDSTRGREAGRGDEGSCGDMPTRQQQQQDHVTGVEEVDKQGNDWVLEERGTPVRCLFLTVRFASPMKMKDLDLQVVESRTVRLKACPPQSTTSASSLLIIPLPRKIDDSRVKAKFRQRRLEVMMPLAEGA